MSFAGVQGALIWVSDYDFGNDDSNAPRLLKQAAVITPYVYTTYVRIRVVRR